MATNFNENSIVSSGGFKPSSKDTPLDIRTRVETERDIYEIPNPYIGMIVYVKDTGKRFEILTLKEVDTGLTFKNVVDTYKQFTVDLEEYAKIEDVPTKVSELENDKGYLVNQDISGKADVEDIPTKVSELENDRGYATERFVDSKVETINNTINSEINTMNSEIDNINTDLIGVSESIEGSWISVDSKDGYLKDIEILGNTIQDADNLADIRSVGDKLENQELYEIPVLIRGKNLCIGIENGQYNENGVKQEHSTRSRTSKIIQVLPNSTITISGWTGATTTVFYMNTYDENMRNISRVNVTMPLKGEKTVTIPSNAYFVSFTKDACIVADQKVQIEVGDIATEYEPYQEQQITILSPMQLEKVGDVADRIVEKDGVWGVEKNINTLKITENEDWRMSYGSLTAETRINTRQFYINSCDNLNLGNENKPICNKFKYGEPVYDKDVEGITFISNGTYRLRIGHTSKSVDEFKEWLRNNDVFVKYPTTQPQFIPLPYDQQIKLRAFANKTNISFGCEIEPTLKAQIPKSIGATVNSHTEQIDNLSKEIDKINNLEESIVSTVTTESDFTTVENTNNGYFEDVKLEGRTLVNLASLDKAKITHTFTEGDSRYICSVLKHSTLSIDATKEYTFIFNVTKCDPNRNLVVNQYGAVVNLAFPTVSFPNGIGLYIVKLKTKLGYVISENSVHVTIGCGGDNSVASDFECSIIILEGDHTQNPPAFFEGLKSVGQDINDITIATTNAPMFFGKGGKK